MKIRMNRAVVVGLTLAAVTGCSSVTTSMSGYAGQETRGIKSLSENDIAAYLEGKGQGFAKPAELNGYPGPMHVLELGDRLALTPEQQLATTALLKEHKQEVRTLGREYIASEQTLERLFASKSATPETLKLAVDESARLQSRIRAAHLETHLKQTALLTPEQVASYQRLRGYQGGDHAH